MNQSVAARISGVFPLPNRSVEEKLFFVVPEGVTFRANDGSKSECCWKGYVVPGDKTGAPTTLATY